MLNSSKSLRFYHFSCFIEKSQIIFLIVFNTNKPVNASNAALLANSGTFLGFAWSQHDFNMNSTTIVMQDVAQNIVKIQSKNEISMNSAWIQHQPVTPIQKQRIVFKTAWKQSNGM